MQRYFIPSAHFHEKTVMIDGDDAHHLIRVMRAQAGDQLICSNGSDREALVAISKIGKSEVHAAIVEDLPLRNEPLVHVWVAQSLPKGDKMDWVIQKCTELGAVRFIPFVSERTIVEYDDKKQTKRLERWRKIAKEAAEQAHRNRLPMVDAPVAWQGLLDVAKVADVSLFCYELEDENQLKTVLCDVFSIVRPESRPNLLLVIGPEGGFTADEAEKARAAGFRTVSLGRRILRTETAAMAGLACIYYESGEMGG